MSVCLSISLSVCLHGGIIKALFFFRVCVCLQLMGFIYACYVVKLISEEEDSCKYTVTHISMQTSHVFCTKACRRLPCAAVPAFQALCAAVGWRFDSNRLEFTCILKLLVSLCCHIVTLCVNFNSAKGPLITWATSTSPVRVSGLVRLMGAAYC